MACLPLPPLDPVQGDFLLQNAHRIPLLPGPGFSQAQKKPSSNRHRRKAPAPCPPPSSSSSLGAARQPAAEAGPQPQPPAIPALQSVSNAAEGNGLVQTGSGVPHSPFGVPFLPLEDAAEIYDDIWDVDLGGEDQAEEHLGWVSE